MDVLRPFLLIALVAFTLGFAGYFAVARPIPIAGTAPIQSDPSNPIRSV